MLWKKGRRSSNVEDRRNMSVARAAGGAGILSIIMRVLPFLLARRSGKLAVFVIGGIFLASFLGVDLSRFFGGGPQMQASAPRTNSQQINSPENQQLADFVSVVLADTEDTWHLLMKQLGKSYQEPNLVLFTNHVRSACGFAEAAMGPFYCPGDQKIYIDLSFYHDLKHQHGATGDFAQAYVIAHEVGHHIQTLLGISEKVHNAKRRLNQVEANKLAVKQELQADCLAGIWAHHAEKARGILEEGDLEEALNAAAAIGDDRLQKQARGYITPDSFTHGSSKQRVHWFMVGVKSGKLAACDTFSKL